MEYLELYEFKEDFREGQSNRTVCIGRKVAVEAALGTSDFGPLFGGSITYRDDKGVEYLGVWGRRKAQRFRRLLRERGADVNLSHDRPSGISVWVRSAISQLAR